MTGSAEKLPRIESTVREDEVITVAHVGLCLMLMAVTGSVSLRSQSNWPGRVV